MKTKPPKPRSGFVYYSSTALYDLETLIVRKRKKKNLINTTLVFGTYKPTGEQKKKTTRNFFFRVSWKIAELVFCAVARQHRSIIETVLKKILRSIENRFVRRNSCIVSTIHRGKITQLPISRRRTPTAAHRTRNQLADLTDYIEKRDHFFFFVKKNRSLVKS